MTTDLKIARGFSLPAAYITKTAAILSKKRIGKTYNASVIAEEFVAVGLPFVVLDPTSAWYGLRASADGKSDGLPVTIIGGEHGDLPLDVGSGKVVADLVVEEPGYYVVDLGHWENDSEHRRWAAPFLDRVYRRKAKLKDPLHMFIDEADVFAPQKPQRGDEQMLHNMQAIVRRGGIRGLGTTLITQRAAVLNKDVLTQLDLLIILRTIAPQDQNAVDDYIKRGAASEREEIMASLASLKPGEAWIYGPGEDPPIVKRVQFRERRTFNSSATPESGERVEPQKMAAVDLEKVRKRLAESIEKAKAEDPKELRKRIAELEKKIASTPEPAAAPIEVKVPFVPVKFVGQAQQLYDNIDAIFSVEVRSIAMKLADVAMEARQLAEDMADIEETQAVRNAGPVPVLVPQRGGNATTQRLDRPGGSQGPSPQTGDVSRPQQAILNALGWWMDFGKTAVTKTQLAMIARVSAKSSGFRANVSTLSGKGLVSYPSPGMVALTAAGEELAGGSVQEPSHQEMMSAALAAVSRPQGDILQALFDNYPDPYEKSDLAKVVGVPSTSSGFRANVSTLSGLDFVTYPQPGFVLAAAMFFD